MSEQNVQVTQALEPCPFCGGRAHVSDADEIVYCRCGTQMWAKDTLQEAIAAWNHRTRAEPDLVEAGKLICELRRRSRPVMAGAGLYTYQVNSEPDPLCQRAADMIAALTRADGEVK